MSARRLYRQASVDGQKSAARQHVARRLYVMRRHMSARVAVCDTRGGREVSTARMTSLYDARMMRAFRPGVSAQRKQHVVEVVSRGRGCRATARETCLFTAARLSSIRNQPAALQCAMLPLYDVAGEAPYDARRCFGLFDGAFYPRHERLRCSAEG